MALNLYRRHRRDCKSGHPEESKSSDLEERRKGWKRCECPIFVSGSLSGRFRRQSTGQWEWDAAKSAAGALEAAGSWSDTGPVAAPPSPESPQRFKIADAIQAFIAHRQNRGLTPSTLKKYRTLTRQLSAFVDSKGFVMLDQLGVSDMDMFYASWKDGIRSKAKKLETLKSFVKFCRKRKWMTEDITEDLEAPEGSSIPANKAPFTDDELERLFTACDQIGGPKPPGPGYRPWGGEDVRDFIMLSIYTGLRISDVSMFNIAERLNGNDVFLRMHKTRKELYTWVPDWLVARLHTREHQHGPFIFRAGTAMNMRAVSERWRDNVGKVFELAGPFDTPPTPHRFRHTFVRMLLEKGVPIADVAELVGDTEQVLKRHYAKWVPERQARLSKILKEALDDKPRPRLITISKRG
jgi:integrase